MLLFETLTAWYMAYTQTGFTSITITCMSFKKDPGAAVCYDWSSDLRNLVIVRKLPIWHGCQEISLI